MNVAVQPTLTTSSTHFLRGGHEHLIISGAIHYFRVHPGLWRDRLRRLVAMGCNTVETYVAWNIHEPREGEFTFAGAADLGRFLEIAQDEGLDAIVRPGPFICAEWDNGGFPGWLLNTAGIRVRTSQELYLRKVDAFFDQLIPIIARHQAHRGGNVIMVQVENEYGSYGDDKRYLAYLRDGLRNRGITEMLVTSDGPGAVWLRGGTIDGALATLNFGSRTEKVREMALRELPNQPYMCMEFWNGWFDHWGSEHHTREASDAAAELDAMLSRNMSVNFYMAHGGTNTGLGAGANEDEAYHPTITSYDYDAPIAEDGTLTEKFFAFREVIAKYRDLPPLGDHLAQLGIAEHPATVDTCDVAFTTSAPLRATALWDRNSEHYPAIPNFETAGIERGLMHLHRTLTLERNPWDKERTLGPLHLYDLRGRAWVFIDGLPIGTVDRESEGSKASIELASKTEALLGDDDTRDVRIDVLVDGQGGVNFGPMVGHTKGINGGIWHLTRFLKGWSVSAWPLETMGKEIERLAAQLPTPSKEADSASTAQLPLLASGTFTARESAGAFLEITGGGYGVAFINRECVGRYWSRGPQTRLYVPGPMIRAGENRVSVIELEAAPSGFSLHVNPAFQEKTVEEADGD